MVYAWGMEEDGEEATNGHDEGKHNEDDVVDDGDSSEAWGCNEDGMVLREEKGDGEIRDNSES